MMLSCGSLQTVVTNYKWSACSINVFGHLICKTLLEAYLYLYMFTMYTVDVVK